MTEPRAARIGVVCALVVILAQLIVASGDPLPWVTPAAQRGMGMVAKAMELASGAPPRLNIAKT